MDSEQALSILEQTPPPAPSERLRCARFLARYASESERSRILRIKEGEHNSWIQRALNRALRRTEESDSKVLIGAEGKEEETPSYRQFYEDVYAQASEDSYKMLVHELRPLVGILELDADKEINCYSCSNTRVSVDGIRSFLSSIDLLRNASEAPNIREFDLTDLVVRVSEAETRRSLVATRMLQEEEGGSQIRSGYVSRFIESTGRGLTLARSEPVPSLGAPELVELALGNVFRNSIEAILAVQDERRGGIVLNWGNTDVDSWIVVLDEGCGLPEGSVRIMEPGVSTKKKGQSHFGMGLSIAQKALHSIDGTIELTPQPGVGARCELRWTHRSVSL